MSQNSRSAAAQSSATSVNSIGTLSGKAPRVPRSENTKGMLYGIAAYTLWGLLPLYFILLFPAGPVEIVAGRVLWSLIFCALLIAVTRTWAPLAAALKNPKVFWPLALAAGLIAINWLTYTYGVTTGQTVEASLGYFINPLVSVLLGVLVLKEKLRKLQWAAVGIGFIAVIVLTISYGKLPWIALTLALSFGFYGFVKKRVGSQVDALASLTVETVVLAPFAAVVMIILTVIGQATMTAQGPGHFWIMAASGVITAVPLLLFGASARRLPMTTIGLLQYFAPMLQFIFALTILGETMTIERWIGFGIVWLALLLLTVDMLSTNRKNSAARRLTTQLT